MIHVVLLLYIVSNYIGLLAADHTFIDAARHIQVAKYDMEISLRPEHISSVEGDLMMAYLSAKIASSFDTFMCVAT